MTAAGSIWIGTSGWNYQHWAGEFYPPDLRQPKWLSFYTQYFATVELNNTFYRLPKLQVFAGWRERSPDGFLFAVKANRFITHVKKLSDPVETLRLFAQNVAALGEKLGPVLFQLPPSWRFNAERVRDFFGALRGNDLTAGWRISLEIRNETWDHEAAFQLLADFGVSLCLADWPDLNVEGPLTCDDFVYVRRHGPTALYASGYTDDQLRRDAERIATWSDGGADVFVYFNNDFGGWAVKNARTLLNLLKELGCANLMHGPEFRFS